MTLARPQRKLSAAQARAFGRITPPRATRHRSALTSMAILAVVAVLTAASPAAAVVITGGPTYSPGGSWGCSGAVAGNEKLAGGATWTCTGTAGAFSNLYIGIKNNN